MGVQRPGKGEGFSREVLDQFSLQEAEEAITNTGNSLYFSQHFPSAQTRNPTLFFFFFFTPSICALVIKNKQTNKKTPTYIH